MEQERNQGSRIGKKPEEEAAGKEAQAGAEQGRTHIDEAVVEKVAGTAAREIPGVWDLGAAPARAVGTAMRSTGMSEQRGRGVAVEVGERQAAVDLTLVIEYGESIPSVTQEVRDNVTRRIEGICGLEVTEVNIEVNDLHFPGEEEPEARVE
jgi:uncharacterized alkaline shock family protein YloU